MIIMAKWITTTAGLFDIALLSIIINSRNCNQQLDMVFEKLEGWEREY